MAPPSIDFLKGKNEAESAENQNPLPTGCSGLPKNYGPLVNGPTPGLALSRRIARGSHVGLPRRQPTDQSRHLTVEQVINLLNAVAFSNSIGHPLLVQITVIWAHFDGFSEDKLGPMTTRLFDRTGKWLRKRGIELRAVWTRERGHQKGHHLHALVNVPIKRIHDLNAYLQQAFRISTGGLRFKFGQFGMRSLRMQMGALRYACKALDHRAFKYQGFVSVNIADTLGIQHIGTDGVIKAKRAGWTENIGPTARRRADWRELRHIDQLAAAFNPVESPRRRSHASCAWSSDG